MINFEPQLAEIKAQLLLFQQEDRRLFATSSFQTNSVVLLHLLSKFAPEVPVYMMNTGFLFPETLEFRDRLVDEFGLVVHTLISQTPRLQQRCGEGRMLLPVIQMPAVTSTKWCRWNQLLRKMMLDQWSTWFSIIHSKSHAKNSAHQKNIAIPSASGLGL